MGKSRTAEIAGAGLAGLSIAAALAQQGWKVRVHEKGVELREIGAGLYLYENALNALRTIGVYDQVAQSGVSFPLPRRLYDHNHRLVRMGREKDRLPELIVVLRTELHRMLSECALSAGVEIVTNSQALGASSEGCLEFSHGFGDKADLVVGADGVFSRVRDSLGLTRKIVDLKDGCGRHLIPREADDMTNRSEVWNHGRRIGIAPTSKDYHYVFLCCPAYDTAGRIQQPFNLNAWIDSHPWYEKYLSRIPRHPEEMWRPFFNIHCHSWSSGRVAIVGDAAHSMAPNLGQGACIAICNAVTLSRVVTESPDIAAALKRWEQYERPYIDITQRNSFLYGYFGANWPRSLLGLRSRLLPLVARSDRFQRSMRSAVDHVSSL